MLMLITIGQQQERGQVSAANRIPSKHYPFCLFQKQSRAILSITTIVRL